MNAKPLSIIAIIFAIGAIALAVAAFNSGNDRQAFAQDGAVLDGMRVDALAQQVASLRAEVARHSKPELDAEPVAPSREAVHDHPADPTRESRISALEAAVTRLEADLRVYREARTAMTPATEAELRSAQQVASDYRAPDKERIEALRKLRMGNLDGKPAITEDVVRSLVDLGERSPDENIRTDVYRNLHNTESPMVRDSMLRALASDPSAKVRKKVAQDINTYISESIVKTALRRAAENDVDEAVRTQAKRTLSKDDD